MAGVPVQSAKGTSNLATVTASFATPPTNGNVIVLCFAADDYNGTPNAGWTQSTGMEQQTFHGSYLWWRVASGGSNSFQYTIGSASPSSWVLMEVSGLDGSPYDVSNGQYATGSTKTYSTPALTPSAGDRLLVAAVNFNRNSGTLAGNTVTGWTNSFSAVDSIGSGPSGTNTTASLATRSVTGNGSTSYSTSGTSDLDVTSASGLIIAFKVASGGGSSDTLSCDSGSFSVGGTAASLKAGFNLTASGGALAITGTAATLRAGYGLPADAGAFAVTGGAAALTAALKLGADAGAFVIAGTTAALRAGTVLTADAGAFLVGGMDAALKASRVLVADPGAFIWTGTDADLIDDSGSTGYVLDAEPGSFQVTGTDANLVYVPKVSPVDPDQTDTHDGRVWDFSQSERDEQERTRARRASEKQLRRAIERAVNIVRGSDEVPSQVAPVEETKPNVAELVMLDINTNGLSASLESIERLLAQYEAQIADEELENDALALLLLAA